MNRYPSSADLAAFRADINRRNGGAWLRPDPRDGGAHMFERLHGCPEWPPASQTASLLRREAAALRSRAYERHPCGSVAHVLTLADKVTCQRRADHDGSHCARLPGAWQWWNRDDAPPPVEIPMAAYVNGGRPRDWIEPKPTR